MCRRFAQSVPNVFRKCSARGPRNVPKGVESVLRNFPKGVEIVLRISRKCFAKRGVPRWRVADGVAKFLWKKVWRKFCRRAGWEFPGCRRMCRRIWWGNQGVADCVAEFVRKIRVSRTVSQNLEGECCVTEGVANHGVAVAGMSKDHTLMRLSPRRAHKL